MKHILLPTDFSENSWNAISYAIHLFKDDACTFYLLNTYTPVIYHVEYVLGYPAQFGLEDTIRNTSLEHLKTLKQRISDTFGNNSNHEFQTMARFDTLISGIHDFMESHTIHMIVMGTKGATGAEEVLFGSNTVQVFKNVKCPVLAIPDGFIYITPSSILFPSDYGIAYHTSQLEPLLALAKTHHSKIDILHVLTTDLSEVQLNNKASLQKILPQGNHEFHDLKGDNVMRGILAYQEKNAVDMLAMINNKKSFFENIFFKSTVNQIGFHLTAPFLVMPSQLNTQKTKTT
jgi:nucleotide-binding universal stress UspA family protein